MAFTLIVALGAVPSVRARQTPARDGPAKPQIGNASIAGFSSAASPPKIDSNSLMILVAGGPGSFIALLRSAGPGFFENALITKKIELPKNWDKLVAKYKTLIPNYEKY